MKNDEVKVSSPSSRLSSTSAFDTLQGGLRSRESRCSRGVLPLQGNYPSDASRVPLESLCARPRCSEPEGTAPEDTRTCLASEDVQRAELAYPDHPNNSRPRRAGAAEPLRPKTREKRRATRRVPLAVSNSTGCQPLVRHGAPANCSLPKGSGQVAPTLPDPRRGRSEPSSANLRPPPKEGQHRSSRFYDFRASHPDELHPVRFQAG